jgi:hypothetical protein
MEMLRMPESESRKLTAVRYKFEKEEFMSVAMLPVN